MVLIWRFSINDSFYLFCLEIVWVCICTPCWAFSWMANTLFHCYLLMFEMCCIRVTCNLTITIPKIIHYVHFYFVSWYLFHSTFAISFCIYTNRKLPIEINQLCNIHSNASNTIFLISCLLLTLNPFSWTIAMVTPDFVLHLTWTKLQESNILLCFLLFLLFLPNRLHLLTRMSIGKLFGWN